MEISYGHGSLHKFDFYSATDPAQGAPLIVFVHGGAWRSEDKADHASLAHALVRLTSCSVAIPNYRLTTPADPIHHPEHACDILRFLHFLLTWPGPNPSTPPPTSLYLLGHSCGAHILGSILLDSPFPELVPSRPLLAATKAVLFSEGLYDIDVLLRSFPGYKQWFIANTFGERADYPDVNVACYNMRPGAEHIRWLVLHSTGDELVDQLQSEIMYEHLSAITRGASSDSRPMVQKNFEEMNEAHNALLKGAVYPRIVADFIVADAAVPSQMPQV